MVLRLTLIFREVLASALALSWYGSRNAKYKNMRLIGDKLHEMREKAHLLQGQNDDEKVPLVGVSTADSPPDEFEPSANFQPLSAHHLAAEGPRSTSIRCSTYRMGARCMPSCMHMMLIKVMLLTTSVLFLLLISKSDPRL